MKYIQKNSITGRLDYRRSFPIALRPDVPGKLSQLKRSLGAKDIKEPGALDNYNAASAEYERLVVLAAKRQSGSFDTLDGPAIAYMAAVFENEWQAEADRNWSYPVEDEDGTLSVNDMMLDDFVTWKREDDFDEIEKRWASDAEALLLRQSLVLDPTDPDRLDRLCIALNNSAIRVCIAIQKGNPGEQKPLPDIPVSTKATEPPVAHIETFEALVLRVMGLPQVDISPSVRQETSTALKFFREAFDQPTPAEITKRMVTEWIELLSQRPRELPKSQRNLPLRKLAEIYQGRTDIQRVAPQTYQGRVSCLAKRWDQAASTGWMAELPNPFRGHSKAKSRPSTATKGLSPDELQAIFSLPIFTAGERPGGGKGEASYWLPLILLTTGARPEDAAQLLVSDIWQSSGEWWIRYTDEGVHPAKGQQSLKTDGEKSGRRTIPVPQRLLDLNLVGYLNHLKETGETALFPRLRPKGARNLLFEAYSDWWSKYLRDQHILPKGRRASRELRHVWTTAARVARVPLEASSYIQGHAVDTGNAQSHYGHPDAWGLYIRDVDPIGPDWTKVLPWQAPA